jgi:hypothetical protein
MSSTTPRNRFAILKQANDVVDGNPGTFHYGFPLRTPAVRYPLPTATNALQSRPASGLRCEQINQTGEVEG